MDTIELWKGNTKALVDPLGAWLTNLSDDYGDVLYPKRMLVSARGDKKQRGGCHVCLPNFGPGGDSGQPQHGFGRELPWSVMNQESSKVVLELDEAKDGYEALHSRLSYVLADSSIALTLEVTNTGHAPLRVAPGFHPYFALDRGEEQMLLNGRVYEAQDLAGTEFFDGQTSMVLKAHRRNITLRSDGLPTWAFWTDRLGEYVCVEPTVGGYTFLHKPTPEELLEPGVSKSYQMTISW